MNNKSAIRDNNKRGSVGEFLKWEMGSGLAMQQNS